MKKKISRYLFILLTVFLISGLSGGFPAAFGADNAVTKSTDTKKTVEWKTVYPGVYDKEEQELVNATKEYLAGDSKMLAEKLANQLSSGKKGVGDMELNGGLGLLKDYTVGLNSLITAAKKKFPMNPLYNDAIYAKKTKYNGLIAAPFAVQVGIGFPYIPKGTDVWISSDDPAKGRGLDHEVTFYKPVYPDDTLHAELKEQSFTDITDPKGSKVRAFRVVGRGDIYNQKGELVISDFHSGIETFKVLKERSMVKDYAGPLKIAVNKPDGYWDKIRDWHVYTDADWTKIKDLWSKEEIRGSKTRYWEDVKVGDEPTWTVDGPFLNGGRTTEPYAVREILMSGNADDIKEKLKKDEHGIYRLKDSSSINSGMPDGMPGGMPGGAPGGQPGQGGMPGGQQMGTPPGGGQGGAPGGQSGSASASSTNPKVRSSFQNTVGAEYATRVVTNWMGDDGWLYKFCWRLAFSMDVGQNQFPKDFDRPSYLYKVPSLVKQGKFMLTHGFDGDIAITKAYVCDKYIKDGKHYVDLVVWLETIDGQVWSECYAVVELPSKTDKKASAQ